MPPKNVYTEESILDAVISLARREGPGAVAARAIPPIAARKKG